MKIKGRSNEQETERKQDEKVKIFFKRKGFIPNTACIEFSPATQQNKPIQAKSSSCRGSLETIN